MPYMKIEYYENGQLKSFEGQGWFVNINFKTVDDVLKKKK